MRKQVYEIKNGYVQLSEEEIFQKKFDIKKLARTLGINENDASLLKSEGKTYVFAKSNNGNIYMLYHADLSVNNLNIYIEKVTEEYVENFKKEWNMHDAPYAKLLGQSDEDNHFVC